MNFEEYLEVLEDHYTRADKNKKPKTKKTNYLSPTRSYANAVNQNYQVYGEPHAYNRKNNPVY